MNFATFAGLEALRKYEKVLEEGGDGDAMQRALELEGFFITVKFLFRL